MCKAPAVEVFLPSKTQREASALVHFQVPPQIAWIAASHGPAAERADNLSNGETGFVLRSSPSRVRYADAQFTMRFSLPSIEVIDYLPSTSKDW